MASEVSNEVWRLAGRVLGLGARLGIGPVVLLAWLALAAGPAAAEPMCTDTWTGGASTEAWATAGNWSTGVPGFSDVACVGSGVTVRVSEGAQSVGSLQDEGTLVVSGGSLEVSEGSGVSAVDSLSLSGGTLSLAGDLDVASSFTSSGNATVSGAGRLVVQSSATGTLGASGCSLLTLSAATLRNEGTVTLGAGGGVSGQLDMAEGAKLENAGTFNAASYPAGCVPGSNSASIQSNGGSPSVGNTGTFNADAGSGHAVSVSVPFDNEGTVHVASGVLNPTGGGSSTKGTWTTASGTEVGFTTGSFSLTHDDASGAKLALSGGTLSIATGPTTVGSVSLSGGTLSLSGELDVSGSLTSSGNATVSGAGHLVVQSGATGTLGAGGCSLLTLSAVTLFNEGTVTLGESGGVSGQLDMVEGAKLENAGTFNADSYPSGCVPGSNSAAIQNNGGAPSASNTGTFNVGAGSGHTAGVSVPFSNTGTVHVASGVLNPTGGGSSTEGIWTTASGTEVSFTTGSFSLTHDDASGAKVALSGGTLSIGTGTTTVDSLSLTGGTLSLSGELDVDSSLVSSGNATVSGAGHLVLKSGATGTLGAGGCSLLTLSAVTLFNEGTVTLGESGGVSGQLDMVEGAKLENAGTFNADSYPSGCVPGSNSAAIQNNGGAPSASNTGTFNGGAGSGHTASVSVPFNNGGALDALSGTVQFSGGGIPEHIATGTWSKESGASIVLSAGTCVVAEEADLSAVEVTGATVERVAVEGPPTVSLSSRPYAAGTVEASGTGHAVGSPFASAEIEVPPSGTGEWVSLCGPLTPGLGGEFGCAWNTLSGSFPDGHYQLRAQLTNNASPPASAASAAITVLVDNAAPSGSLTAPSYLGTASTVTGTADDTGSGIESWQLQIAPAGTSEWSNACAAQTTPSSGDHYSCTANTTGLADGSFQLRAILTDNAHNTYTTSASSTTVDRTSPSGSLGTLSASEYVRGTLSVEGTGSDSGSGVASWTPQIAPAGSSSWSNACSSQSTPVSGSTYGCAVDSTGYGDGEYQMRARVVDSAGNSYTTSAQAVGFDNTPPAGSLSSLSSPSSGLVGVTGSATDAASGVASWQLQIRPTGPGVWQSACLSQSVPIEGSEYGCSVDTTLLANGPYQLRAVLVDNAGNSHVTSSVATRVENSGGSEGPSVGCSDIWTGEAGDEAWQTAGNWSTGTVPGESDHACIPAGGTAHISSGTHTVGSIRGAGGLVLSGGTLDLSDASTLSEFGSLTVQGGIFTGSGTVEISEVLSWTGGEMTGSGQTVLASGAGGSIDAGSGGHVWLEGRTLTNAGTLTLVDGAILLAGGAEIDNTGTFDVNSQASSYTNQIEHWTGTTSLVNTGTVQKTSGTGTTRIGVAFTNDGTLDAASGHIGFYSGADVTLGTGSILKGPLSLEGASVTASGNVSGEEASITLSAGSLTIDTAITATAGSFTQTGGTLTGGGTLHISEALSWTGGEMTGSGQTVLASGAGGSIDAGSGGHVWLEGRTLTNAGTLTLVDGAILLASGAQISNAGTFDVNSQASSSYTNQIEHWTGTTSLVNTGTVQKTSGTGTTRIGVVFDNEGSVVVQSGQLAFAAGGPSGLVAPGSWTAQSGASLAFDGGTFIVGHESVLTGTIYYSGGTVVRAQPPTGSMTSLPYAAGSVTIGGTGSSAGSGVTGASIQVAVAGSGSWGTLCGSLTPDGSGTFSCSWNTTGGSWSDGSYEVRAQLADNSRPPIEAATSPITVLVDNTPPSGSLSSPSYVVGTTMLSGSASDSGSGVASWQLQISPSGESAWLDACEAQTLPTSGSTYGCAVDTTAYTDGEYHLRAIITDHAGNTHTTSSATTKVDNTTLVRTLAEVSADVHGTVSLTGTASSSRWGVASWTPQLAPIGSGTWTNACAPQTTPLSGSEYGCSVNTTELAEGEYEARAVAVDGAGKTLASTVQNVVVDNTPPEGEVEGLPESVGGTFEVLGTASDALSGVATWTLEMTPAGSEAWESACLTQGAPVSGLGLAYGCSLDVGSLAEGSYELRALITDRAGNTYTTPTVAMVVDNSPLSLSIAPAISGETVDGQTLAAGSGTWGGGGPITYSYQWQTCDTAGETCRDIPGANGEHYVLSDGDVGSTLRVVVQAKNGLGEESATSAATGTVTFGTLGNISAPAVSGADVEGATLTTDPGSWRGVRPLSYGYQWRRCNTSGAECADISSATASSYKPVEGDIGSTLRVIVTASNSEGSASETSAATHTITTGSGGGIRYLYDQAGRLSILDDPTKGAAKYSWDGDGNLLSIGRVSQSTLSVLAFTPTRAPVGDPVDITGTGFDPNPANDAVSFDGTSATVTSASATDITATVPEGAAAGAITVTVGGNSASSSATFTPGASGDTLAPSVTGLSPGIAASGDTVTLSGSNLLASSPATSVTVNGLYASPPAGSSSSLTFTVPPAATSGPVQVGTAHGLVNGGDLFVAPPEHTVEQVGPTGRMEFEHASTASFTAGKIGMFLFDGTRGHSIDLQVGGWSMSSGSLVQVYVLAPDGSELTGSQEGFTAAGSDVLAQLPLSGTYTVVVIPHEGATGGLSLTPEDTPPVNTTILPSATGGEASLALTLPGQQGRATFSGRPGERVLIEGEDPENHYGGTMTLYGPGGGSLGSTGVDSAGLLDAMTLPSNGTYTIVLQGLGSLTGTVALKAFLVAPDLTGTLTPTSEGALHALTFQTPGQNAVLTFTGTGGEKVAVGASSWSLSDADSHFPSNASTYVVAPSGAIVGEGSRTFYEDGFYSVQVLPESGTYKIVADPGYATTGGLTLTARKVTDVSGTLTPTSTGASRSLSLEVPGQGARETFSGAVGEKVSLALSEWSLSSGCLVLSIEAPDGSMVGGSGASERYCANGFYDTLTLPSTGTYRINVSSPQGATGTVTLTAYEATDVTGTITVNGSPVTTEIGTPGQNALLTFTGSEGQTVTAEASEATIPSFYLTLIAPGGSQLYSEWFNTSGGAFEKTLPVSGTYTLLMNPFAANTGNATITLSESTGEPHSRRILSQPPIGQTPKTPPAQTAPAKLALRIPSSPNSPAPAASSAPSVGTGPAGTCPPSAATKTTKVCPGVATGRHHAALVKRQMRHRARRHAHRAVRHARRATHHPRRHTKTRHTPQKAAGNITGAIQASAGAASTSSQSSSNSRSSATDESAVPAAVSDYRSPYTAAWAPTSRNERDSNWVTGRGPSPWGRLPALADLPATTGLTGQALVIDGRPLRNVTLTVKGTTVTTKTDRTGRFLLAGLPAGHQVLIVDGSTATDHPRRYGQFSVGVDLTAGQTTALGYTIWMTPLDAAGDTTIASPLRHAAVLRNPRIPGLEVRLPAGTVVHSAEGTTVHHLNLTAVPVDRPPFPLPFGNIPTYFTVQPGRAYLNKGAQIIYPNWGHLPPHQRVDFWNYDPADKGWYIYGKGSISTDGKQVVPDPDVRIWEFTGAMISSTGQPPTKGPVDGAGTNDGDPVDLASGLFVYHHTDLSLPDSSMPVSLTRTYRPGDNTSYSYGLGMTSPFDIHLWSNENWHSADLVLPDGGKIEYLRTSPGTGYTDAVYTATNTPGEWKNSVMTWNGEGWSLRRRDGVIYFFGVFTGLQGIQDANGNRITLVREGGPGGPIKQIRTPHGRWIDLTYDGYNRITQAKDNAGQTVTYEYDSAGRLEKVTDPKGNTMQYAYNTSNDMTSVTDARGHTLITNTYDSENRVKEQSVMGHGTYTFTYYPEIYNPVVGNSPPGTGKHCGSWAASAVSPFLPIPCTGGR